VAAVDECEYCQAAYTGATRVAGFSLDETVSIRRGYLTDREDLSALLALAREVADHRGRQADTDPAMLRPAEGPLRSWWGRLLP
jgi:hypothetical protein